MSEIAEEAQTLLASERTVSRSKIAVPVVATIFMVAVVGLLSGGARTTRTTPASEFLGLSGSSSESSGCTSPEPVDCQLGEEHQKSLVFISSTSLENPAAKATYEELAAKLPRKGEKGLKVLLLEDAGLLKNCFWDPSNKNHLNPRAMNFEKVKNSAGMNFGIDDVKSWTDGFQNMDGGWSYDNAGADGLGVLGLEDSDFTKVSVFGLCASKDQAKALFELQSKKVTPSVAMTVAPTNPCLKTFEKMLDESNVIFANGGNPDVLGFVIKHFAPELGKLIQKRVQEGTLLYTGRSAGGMVGGSDFALTYEPSPALTTTLLGQDTKGLGLAGKCALRPHIKNHIWDITSKMYAKATGQTVILAANGEGLFCNQGCCAMTGLTEKTDAESIKNAGMSASRIETAYKAAYDGYAPDKFFEGTQGDGQCGATSAKAILTSDGLESPAALEAFQALLSLTEKDVSTMKVVSLDDGAYLSKGFWDTADAGFAKPQGVNYLTLKTATDPAMVQAATEGFKGLVPGAGSMADTALEAMGIPASSISHISAFDRCATAEQKKALFQMESAGVMPTVSMQADESCVSALAQEVAAADVVVMGDGNADFLSFVYKKFSPSLGQALVKRVAKGAIFLGLGAGSTFASASTMAAGHTGKHLSTYLENDMAGLGLVGNCAVRPHFNPDLKWWDMTSALFQDATKIDFVGLEDGAALVCSAGKCTVSGEQATKMAGPDSGSFHRGRVHMVLDKVMG